MMYALILAPARAEQVRKAVKEYGEVVYDQAGTMDSFGIRNAIQSAARVAADVLVLDIDAGPGPDLVAAVRGYRIARPYTRIFLLAPGRQPGDATVAKFVGLGVYDIIDGPVEADWGDLVARALASVPATYAHAARWHIMTGLTGEEEQVKEKVVIEQRPVGVVTIAVAGAASGLGCTHTALAISAFLARQGHNVALVEDSQNPVMQDYLKIIKAGPGRVSKAWRIKGFDVFPFAKTEVDKFIEGDGNNFIFDELLPELSTGRYEYIVRDLGTADKKRTREAFRSNLAVLVASAARWRWGDLLKIEPLSSFRLVLVAPAELDVKEIRKIPELKAYVMPYHPDPFCMPDEVLAELLRPVLPQSREKKKQFWVRFRVAAATPKRPPA
ncbi:P-loop containing nucleoside triphosphate hydrolase [Moorella glycerini]|uniref:Uncharacterized protein n=1 Tax=Neomoorella stamsii TaxID=1266720 RepID=A0A9X7J5Z0_9FIRM|nr:MULTISPECIES: hypothetical protein [Moorella]PRR76321.1 hypothetical protein MOST_04820 [Moorella stamsii]CEP67111.1 P-loop containing nucleoside triphosphate hydrolase [Moorella glycerini]